MESKKLIKQKEVGNRKKSADSRSACLRRIKSGANCNPSVLNKHNIDWTEICEFENLNPKVANCYGDVAPKKTVKKEPINIESIEEDDDEICEDDADSVVSDNECDDTNDDTNAKLIEQYIQAQQYILSEYMKLGMKVD